MSHQKPTRPLQPVKYEDVFNMTSPPFTTQEVTATQAAGNPVVGETPMSGHASVLQSAARVDVRAGIHDHDPDHTAGAVTSKGIKVGDDRVITEKVAGQAVAQYVPTRSPRSGLDEEDSVTIGEALEASALASGNKPVEKSDVAAIQAAEMRATGMSKVLPGGIGEEAQSAASLNPRATRNEEMTTLSDVLTDATIKLPADKVVTRVDAEDVIEAEVKNNPDLITAPGGVAASMAAAVRINRNNCYAAPH